MNTPLPSRPHPSPGNSIRALATELRPLCRSVSGPGTRRILDIIDREIGLIRTEVPSGSPALDWLVPPEWSVSEAWIRDGDGTTVADLADGTLGVVDRSPAVRGRIPLSELRSPCLHAARPAWRGSPAGAAFGGGGWGVCMRHRDFERMAEGLYEVLIASEDRPGRMSYGEHLIRGRTGREFLLSAHGRPLAALPTTTLPPSRSWWSWRGPCPAAPCGIRTGSCSGRRGSAPSPGWRGTRRRRGASITGSSSPASAAGCRAT